LYKDETNELENSGFKVELNTGIQNDSLNKVQVEESKSPYNALKLQAPEYKTNKEAFESSSKVHSHKDFIALEETEIKENHLKGAITDLVAEENQSKKIINTTEIILMV
jgi:hypothetical protein